MIGLRLTALGLVAATAAACTRTVVVTPAPDERRADPSTAVTLGIPPGHLPAAGACRIWIPGTPPGRQPHARSRPCAGIARVAPADSWIVYRPTRDRRHVHVRVVDRRRAGVIVAVRIFKAEGGGFVRESRPEDEPWDENEDERRGERPRERPREERPEVQRPDPDRPQDERPQPDRPQEERPRGERIDPSRPATLDIPAGHLPQPGECRIWIPGAPPGQQRHRASGDCDAIARQAPAGSWIVYRPTADRKLVHVRVVDDRRPGVVVVVRIFDAATGRLVREERP